AEHAGGRELAELVPDHVLGHEDLVEDLPVVDLEGVVHELGHDRAATRPGLDRGVVAGLLLTEDLAQQLGVDVRAPLEGASHGLLPLPALLARAHDEVVGAGLRAAGLAALGGHALRPHGVTATGAVTLAAAHRVVVRVLGAPTRDRAVAHPAVAAGLADDHGVVLGVAELADRGAAVDRDLPHLARRQLDGRVRALLRHELDDRARGPPELPALAGLQLDVVDLE